MVSVTQKFDNLIDSMNPYRLFTSTSRYEFFFYNSSIFSSGVTKLLNFVLTFHGKKKLRIFSCQIAFTPNLVKLIFEIPIVWHEIRIINR